jgi:hypothetical protein
MPTVFALRGMLPPGSSVEVALPNRSQASLTLGHHAGTDVNMMRAVKRPSTQKIF